MASQITHLLLAYNVHEELFPKHDLSEFLSGTIFPDIRYLRVIERDKTHYAEISLAEAQQEPDAFLAGVKYHSLVDRVRENFMVKHGLYKSLPESTYITQAVKTREDEVYYTRLTNDQWVTIAKNLQTIPQSAMQFNIPLEKLQWWYQQVGEYCMAQPSDQIRKKFIMNIELPQEVADEINRLVAQMRSNVVVTSFISDFYQRFPELVKE